MPSLRDRARRIFESPRAPWIIMAIALVVALPSIQLGFFNDDHAFRAALASVLPGTPPAWDLYRFASGDVETNRMLVEAGVFPWWTAPTFKLHLMRPLAGLLFALDARVFGDSPLGYHLHSIAWYLALVAAVGWVLRGLVSKATANLATLLYATSAAHFFPYGWISCRHMLIAATPALLGLGAWLHDRTPGRTRGRWLLALGLAAGLAGGETAIGVLGFPIALALVGQRNGTRLAARVRAALHALAPALAVVAGYLVLYVAAGGGAKDSGGYVDPFSAPARFAAKAAFLLPVMLANAVLGMPAEIASVVEPAPLVVAATIAVALVAVLARACVPSMADDERSALPWLLAGATLALLPSLGGFPGARILVVPNLGFATLLAVVLRRGLGASTGRRRIVLAGAGLLALLHLVAAPLSSVGNAANNARIAREVETIAASAEIGPGRPRVFVIGVSDPEVTMYVPAVLATTGIDRLSCWSLLSGSRQAHTLTRTGELDLVLRPSEGPLLRGPFETLFRAEHVAFRVGDEARQCGATYRMTAVDAGRPTEVAVRFDRPLDDPSIRFLVWRDGRLRALPPPRVGESIEVASAPGPLGMF